MKFFENLNRIMRKGNLFPIILIVLVAAVLLVSVGIFAKEEIEESKGAPAVEAESAEEDGKLLINDMYTGETKIPKYKYDINTLDNKLFVNEAGRITYPEGFVGIDVSEHQGEIDWQKVKESGVDYAIIRVGYRGYTRGRLYQDEMFEKNVKGATDAGIKIGLYIFSQAVSVTEAEEEAGYILGLIQNYQIDYPIVFDWENITTDDADQARTNGISGADVSQFANAFCTKISKAGYNTAVYMNKNQAYNFYDLDVISQYDIWYAEYQPLPSLYYEFSMWQYTEDGTVAGIEAPCDINVSFKNYSK